MLIANSKNRFSTIANQFLDFVSLGIAGRTTIKHSTDEIHVHEPLHD